AVQEPTLVAAAIERFGAERIVVGIDARDGRVATHGWQQISSVHAMDLAQVMRKLGVLRVVYTDISRDGLLSGVNVEAVAQLGERTGLWVIASGGVRDLEDIRQLKARECQNIEGVIIGQALYIGALDLADAISIASAPPSQRLSG
ncbi:MAG TPA: 1-(5-phosphoribosyl)-5-((5-phosphoribosylamino)methylideneamino)imidazole-4-carboxamide isomerase, partial [Anaerolineae bacterium]|nr:1-(5-phosphoribosyl)-5-((5-phosphoribosylamino)methylideneamino)imidazole-4-carboxamide isomerase [Anaerolineae bacterium]